MLTGGCAGRHRRGAIRRSGAGRTPSEAGEDLVGVRGVEPPAPASRTLFGLREERQGGGRPIGGSGRGRGCEHGRSLGQRGDDEGHGGIPESGVPKPAGALSTLLGSQGTTASHSKRAPRSQGKPICRVNNCFEFALARPPGGLRCGTVQPSFRDGGGRTTRPAKRQEMNQAVTATDMPFVEAARHGHVAERRSRQAACGAALRPPTAQSDSGRKCKLLSTRRVAATMGSWVSVRIATRS